MNGAAEEEEGRPTVAESPGARAAEAPEHRTHGSGKHQRSSVHSATAMRAMRTEELTRARGFGVVVSLVAVIALICQQFVTTAPWLQRSMSASLVIAGAIAF